VAKDVRERGVQRLIRTKRNMRIKRAMY